MKKYCMKNAGKSFELENQNQTLSVSQCICISTQDEAIQGLNLISSYVLTTGTGSGKSLSYIIPIVDHILKKGSGGGIKAIVVYPMNALANSQNDELEKFLKFGFGKNDTRYIQDLYRTRERKCP